MALPGCDAVRAPLLAGGSGAFDMRLGGTCLREAGLLLLLLLLPPADGLRLRARSSPPRALWATSPLPDSLSLLSLAGRRVGDKRPRGCER